MILPTGGLLLVGVQNKIQQAARFVCLAAAFTVVGDARPSQRRCSDATCDLLR